MINLFNFSGFKDYHYAWLILGFALFFISLSFHIKSKNNWALFFLVLSAASLYVFSALLDPFVNIWDERYHALAARNCMDNFLEPRLYKEILIPEYDYLNWTSSHIWLHKQPLFLWQIAIIFKLFGISELTLRLPSIIMSTLLVLIGYRVAMLLVDKKFAYYTAISITFSWFLLNLVSGYQSVEVNDVCFIFYVSASIWSWIEYIKSNRKWKWVPLIGLFAGCAILTKWLPGILIFFVWGLYLIAEYKFKIQLWKIKHILVALLFSVIVALPWQLYTFKNYREAAVIEYQYNSRHFFEPIEGHSSKFEYHFKNLAFLYIGDDKWVPDNPIKATQVIIYIILGAGFLLFLFYLKKNSFRITFLGTFIGVYLFYSFAQTKMPTYPFLICLLGFMSLGAIIYFIDNLLTNYISNKVIKWLILIPIIILFSFRQMNFTKIRNLHTENKETWWRADLIYNKNVYKQIEKDLPENCVIFNVRGDEHNNANSMFIEGMFYTGHDCYPFPPSQEVVKILKAKDYPIAIFTHHPIPDYIKNDTSIIKIDRILKNDM